MGQFSGCSGLRDVDARSAFRSREGKFKSVSQGGRHKSSQTMKFAQDITNIEQIGRLKQPRD